MSDVVIDRLCRLGNESGVDKGIVRALNRSIAESLIR
jgi:hypothetical protein